MECWIWCKGSTKGCEPFRVSSSLTIQPSCPYSIEVKYACFSARRHGFKSCWGHKRVSFNGRTRVFQAFDMGSIPITRIPDDGNRRAGSVGSGTPTVTNYHLGCENRSMADHQIASLEMRVRLPLLALGGIAQWWSTQLIRYSWLKQLISHIECLRICEDVGSSPTTPIPGVTQWTECQASDRRAKLLSRG
jgi:hypothetical protein